jgi:hypothetical protein
MSHRQDARDEANNQELLEARNRIRELEAELESVYEALGAMAIEKAGLERVLFRVRSVVPHWTSDIGEAVALDDLKKALDHE